MCIRDRGKQALMSEDLKRPGELICALMDAGQAVLAIDAFLTGEYHPPDGNTQRNLEGRYPWTFYRTDTSLRAQDVITAVQAAKALHLGAEINLVGVEEGGLWCLLARPFVGGVAATVVDIAGFGGTDEEYEKRLFVPLLRRVGDLRTAAALCAPGRLMMHNLGAGLDTSWPREAYEAVGAASNVRTLERPAATAEIVDWLGGRR